MLDGQVAAYRAALDTKYGNLYATTRPEYAWVTTQYESAMWLEEQLTNLDVWPRQEGYSYYESWSQVERTAINSENGIAKSYFDTVEHHLNTAIYYSAAVINKLLVNYETCDCDDDPGDDGDYNGGGFNGGETIEKINKKEDTELETVAFMGGVGVLFSLIAIGIVKKLNTLAKFAFATH